MKSNPVLDGLRGRDFFWLKMPAVLTFFLRKRRDEKRFFVDTSSKLSRKRLFGASFLQFFQVDEQLDVKK